MAETNNNHQREFDLGDVSRPVKPESEAGIIREQVAFRRSEWLRSHMTLLFAAVSIVLVALIIWATVFYSRQTNPIGKLTQATAKDFDTSFSFKVTASVNDQPGMSYQGLIDVSRSAHRINAVYDADYGNYTYSGAVYSENNRAVKGNYYKDKWTVDDCTDQMHDFFDFEVDYSRGEFDGGALLRFLGLSSEYSADELNRFEKRLRQRLASDKAVARITTQSTENGTEYIYDISLSEVFDDIIENGASLFYHATDYDAFKQRCESNRLRLGRAHCTMRYTIDPRGYLSRFSLNVTTDGESYTLDCVMTDFGSAKVELPEPFLEAATLLKTE